MDLLDRILEKVSLDNYEGIIKIIKLKKRNQKKDKVSGESDDEKFIKKIRKNKSKVKYYNYPKK